MFENINKTSNIKIEGNDIFFNGANIVELMSNATFSQASFLAVCGKLPDQKTTRIIDCLLCAMMPETAPSPSSLAAKIATTGGTRLNGAIATAINVMDEKHGLHIQECMNILKDSVRDMFEVSLGIDDQAEIAVQQNQDRGVLIPGFGENGNSVDIRVEKLLISAAALGFEGNYVKLAKAIPKAYKSVFGMQMPLNIEGAAAAILLEAGVSCERGPAFFILARIPYLVSCVADIGEWNKNLENSK